MSDLMKALVPKGAEMVVTMTVLAKDSLPKVSMVHGTTSPRDVRPMMTIDEDDILGGLLMFTFIGTLPSVPGNLEAYLVACLAEAMTSGAVVAWLATDQTSDLSLLLTRDEAPRVYGVADDTGVHVAVDDAVRNSPQWKTRVGQVRGKFSPVVGAR